MQTANLKVCGGEMVVSVLAVQQVTTGTPEHVGSPFPILQGILDSEEYGIYLDNIEQCAYIHCISDGYCICRYDSLIYLSSLQGELWKLWSFINVLFHQRQVPQIDCKRKVYWRPKPRSMEKGSKLIGTRLWRHPVLDQMTGGRVMSKLIWNWKSKTRRVEASESPVAQFSSDVGWSDLLCLVARKHKFALVPEITKSRGITGMDGSGFFYLPCLGIGWIFCFFANWIQDIEVVLIA